MVLLIYFKLQIDSVAEEVERQKSSADMVDFANCWMIFIYFFKIYLLQDLFT